MSARWRRMIKKMSRVAGSPKRALGFVWLRMLPFGILSADPYAIQAVTASYGRMPRIPLREVFPGIENVDVALIRPFDELSETSTDPREILIISAIARLLRPRNILEIGTSQGNTTLNLAANTPDDTSITTVDLPADWNHQFSLTVPTRFAGGVTGGRDVGRLFKNHPYSRKITQILQDSAQLDWKAMPTPFDLVFLDGCHYFDYVVKDTENALRYSRPGGIIIWHDYGTIKHVSKAVDRVGRRANVKVIQGTTLAVGRAE